MTGRERKRGDLAYGSINGYVGRFICLGEFDGWDEVDGSDCGWDRAFIKDFRPLVVIDPEDREQVERLSRAYLAAIADNMPADNPTHMQAALREFADPRAPKPEEPTGLGAVVEDGDGVRWVRSRENKPGLLGVVWENSAGLSHYPWSGIAAVRVLSEGVQP